MAKDDFYLQLARVYGRQQNKPTRAGMMSLLEFVMFGAPKPSDMQERAMGPDHSKPAPFDSHRCAFCDDGIDPCLEGDPLRCQFPRARND